MGCDNARYNYIQNWQNDTLIQHRLSDSVSLNDTSTACLKYLDRLLLHTHIHTYIGIWSLVVSRNRYRLSLPSPRAQRLNSSGRNICPRDSRERRKSWLLNRSRREKEGRPAWVRPSGKLDWHFVLYERPAAATLQDRTFLSVDEIIQGGTLVFADDGTRGYITLSEKIVSDLGTPASLLYYFERLARLIASV